MSRRPLALALVVLAACADPPKPVTPPWMAGIDDARRLSELSIPGTHESAAYWEPIMGTAKCQNLTLAELLDAGIRYFDIRCRHLTDAFAIFHGPVSELLDFDQVIGTMADFLDAHPTETIVMSVKEESVPEGVTRSFEATFASYVAKAPERWYLGAAVPRLGDVRGKLVLLRRFAATTTPLGIDASMWADNTTFSIANPDASLRVEDAYKVTATDAKWSAITTLLDEARTADPATLYLTYTSGYELHSGIPNVPSVATVINLQLEAWFADPAHAHARAGVLAMDFVDPQRAAAIAQTNPP